MTIATVSTTKTDSAKAVYMSQPQQWDEYFSQPRKGNLLDELDREANAGKTLGFSTSVSYAQTA